MRALLDSISTPRTGSLALVAIVLAIYGPAALANGWAVDDFRFIVDNAYVQSPDSWLRPFVDPTTADAASPNAIVRPLRTIDFMVGVLLGGTPLVLHLQSVLWHALCAVLAFALLRRLLGHGSAAFVAAAAWAAHPMQTESVAWISARADVAMGACVLGSLLAALRSRGLDGWLAASLGLGALGMLYKETAIVLPVLVVAVRLATAEVGAPRPLLAALRGAAPWFVLSVLYWIYRDAVRVGEVAHVGYRLGGSTAGTFATMFRAFGAYLGFAVLPVRPATDWFLPASTTLLDPAALAWLLLHVALLASAALGVRRRPLASLAVALFYVPLIPVANWPFPIGIPTTERFLYVPLVGAALALGLALRRGLTRSAARPSIALPAALAVVCLALISADRARDWRDDRTLYGATVRSHRSARAHAYLGASGHDALLALRRAARETTDPAERTRLERRLRAGLERSLAHSVLAIEEWRSQVVPWPPANHTAAVPLTDAAFAANLLGRHEQALGFVDEALRIKPDLARAHYNRAWALLPLGREAEAVRALVAARSGGMEIDTREALRFFHRAGRALESEGDLAGAREAYELALRLGLDDPLTDESLEALERLSR